MRKLRSKLLFIKRILSLLRLQVIDGWRFFRHSSAFFSKRSKPSIESGLSILAHKIEKGFSLPEPRPGFGSSDIPKIIDLHKRLESVDSESSILEFSLGVLRYYANSAHMSHLSEDLQNQISEFVNERESFISTGGAKPVSTSEFTRLSPDMMRDFFLSRSSVRTFSNEDLDKESIFTAIEIAQKSPSVCNRQPWQVRVIFSEEIKERALSLQNGNRGFGDKAPVILVITAQLKCFHGIAERNEAFIDGGMFSMSLIWGLHALGLGSCALNWCANAKRDHLLRKALNIADDEVVIMLLAVGKLKNEYVVAASPRRKPDEIYSVY